MRRATAGGDAAEWVRPALNRIAYPSLLHRLRAANLMLKGAQNIVPRMNALAACHGLRLHAPLLDTDLAAWTFTLPPDHLLAGACEKYLLKRVAETYLPPQTVWREKRGMGAPTATWCLGRGLMRWAVGGYLAPGRLREEGRFAPEYVRRLLKGDDPTPEGAFRSKRRAGEKIWLLLMWQVWRRAHGVR
jgi:asparagine synthase (glutamine-hydrolysing)